MVLLKLTIRDVPLDNHTVLVRADYDVPLDSLGVVSDDSLIRASLPTLSYLLNRGCKVVIISHAANQTSLEPAAFRLANLLGRDIRFTDITVGDKVYQAIKRAPNNSVIVLENLHINHGEKLNNRDFAKKLVTDTGARYFVQDSPNVVHNSHASTDMITSFIPSVAGFLIENAILQSNNLPGIIGLLDSTTKLE